MVGRKFGRLEVIGPAAPIKSGRANRKAWGCRCDCGTIAVVRHDQLISGHARSCGCLQRDHIKSLTGSESAHTQWAGVEVTYNTAHSRVRRKRGSAKSQECVDCSNPAGEWSYVGSCDNERVGMANGSTVRFCPLGNTHLGCYVPRCVPCHRRLDRGAA